MPVPDIDLPDRRTPPRTPPTPPPRPPVPTPPIPPSVPTPTGATSTLGRVASAAAKTSAVTLPFMLLAEGSRRQREQIEANPNAPGLEFNPYAQTLRGEAETVGQAGRQNRDRAVGQMKWGEVKAFVESDMTDQELYEQLGRNRKELKEWLEQNKDGKTPYDKFTVAPAVASRAAESMIPWETPAVEPPPEVGAPPPITGMESAFVPTAPSAPELEVGPTREMFEADQAQQARNVVMRRRKRPERADASARQQAEIEAGNVVPEPTQPQRVPKPTPQIEPADKAQRPATATVMESTETFDASILAEKDPETHRKYVERQREIVRERQKELESVPFNRQSVARSKIHSEARMQAQEEFFSQAAKVGAASRQTSIASVNERGDSAVVRESMGVQQTQQPTPQVEPAKPKEDETGPVSAAESFLMQQKGLDPNNEFDRKLYRRMDRTENRREQQRMGSQGYAPVDERGRVVGAELNTMSVQNNDLQRQGNAPSSQPIVIQNNSAPSTQTTVTPPAQPRVDSSFSRVMDIRNFWD